MNRSIIPVNTGEQLKFPLHRPLLLFMLNGKIYCCKIIYAGKDFVKVVDIQERKIINEKIIFEDLLIMNETIFKRNRIDGYSPLEEDHYIKPRKRTPAKIVPINK